MFLGGANMNHFERKACETLRELVQSWKIVSVKGEFEDEGLSFDDLVHLKEIVSHVNTPLTVKIGGCGAIYDLLTAVNIGPKNIVAPMIETPYALIKFVSILNEVISEEERNQINSYINIETITGCNNIDDILGSEQIKSIMGIVIGRVDLSKSINLSREAINNKEMFDLTLKLCGKIKKTHLTCGIGGGINLDSIKFLQKMPRGYFDFFETRKIAFAYEMIFEQDITKALKLAIEFENYLLKSKIEEYSKLSTVERRRSELLEKRLGELSELNME